MSSQNRYKPASGKKYQLLPKNNMPKTSMRASQNTYLSVLNVNNNLTPEKLDFHSVSINVSGDKGLQTSIRKFTVMHQNIQCVRNKIHDLEVLLNTNFFA
jgi:hypothetical protein